MPRSKERSVIIGIRRLQSPTKVMVMDTLIITLYPSASPSLLRHYSFFSPFLSLSIKCIPHINLNNNSILKSKSLPSTLSLSSSSSSVSLMSSRVQATAFFAASSSNEESGKKASDVVGKYDLLIVGPGVLGRLVAQQWCEDHPGCQVYGQTITRDHHDELMKMGINPSLKETKLAYKFPYVIFCAPPSRSLDYAGDIREAISCWNSQGSFLFTSSSAVYDCSDNGQCDEDTAVVPIGSSSRTDVILKTENVVLKHSGCVLRLSGLYKADRGAHMYWLKQGKSELRPDHIVNQIHYEDAASLAVAILKKNLRGRIFLGCDNHPLSRQEIMDLVNKSGKFGQNFEGFTGCNGPLGKRLNSSKTREEIGWEPKYPSFAQFLEEL